MKKFLIAFMAALVLCVPAFADSPTYFAADEITISNGETSFTASGSGVSFFVRYSGGYYKLFAISETSTTFEFNNASMNCTNSFGSYYTSLNGFIVVGSSYTTSPLIAYFDENATDADIQAAYAAFLSGASLKTFTATFTVPRGNVLYFKVPEDSVVTFTSTNSFDSSVLHSDYSPWGDTGQRLSEEASLPTTGVSFPRVGTGPISWEKVPPYNVLGQTKIGSYSETFEADQYYAFYNPAYTHIVSSSDGSFGTDQLGATVSVHGTFNFVRIYPLSQLLDNSTSDDGYETWVDGEGDNNGGVIWNDQDDVVSNPTNGGQNQSDTPISSNSLIESIKNILKRILSEIENIFTFGFSAIHNLVELMDEFVSTFDDLYEWLPEPVYTMLISAVVVAITIGVFKVFL